VIDEIKITEIVIVVIKMVMMLIDVSISKFSLHRWSDNVISILFWNIIDLYKHHKSYLYEQLNHAHITKNDSYACDNNNNKTSYPFLCTYIILIMAHNNHAGYIFIAYNIIEIMNHYYYTSSCVHQ